MLAHVLTISRLILAAIFAVCVAVTAQRLATHLDSTMAIVLISLALSAELTDAFDGYLARRMGTAGPLGGILDPLVDSLARLAIYFAMALAGWIALAVPLVMAGRDIVVAYTRVAQAMTGGTTSARFSGKAKAIIQAGGIFAVLLLAWCGPAATERSGDVLRLAVAGIIIAVTIWSMLDYLVRTVSAIRRLHK